jgi:ATP-dependent helicase/nuclease subunit A
VKGLEAPIVFLADPYGESRHEVDICIDRSGDRVRGYLALWGKGNSYTQELLAIPAGWEERAEREARFADAEALRLRYVAATRAGAAMIITQTERNAARNPWNHFAVHLGDRALPDPGPQSAPRPVEVTVSTKEVEQAYAAIAARLTHATEPTYRAAAAKQWSLDDGDVPALRPFPTPDSRLPIPDGEHGLAWGTVVHHLLQVAMRAPEAGLTGVARAALTENELDPDLAPAALETVQAIMQSDLWQRALRSPRRFVEAPFWIREETEEVPTTLRGAIDLVFEEEGGWVLVDYKTDALRGSPDALVAKYAPQVDLYARAWQQATGQPVKARLLFFVQSGLTVPVSD